MLLLGTLLFAHILPQVLGEFAVIFFVRLTPGALQSATFTIEVTQPSVAAGICSIANNVPLNVNPTEICSWSGSYTVPSAYIAGKVYVVGLLHLTVLDSFVLQKSAVINGTGGSVITGPGYPGPMQPSGAAHAGCGSQGSCNGDPNAPYNRAYGDAFAPIDQGSAGGNTTLPGGAGGAAVWIEVFGVAVINGTIDVSGADGTAGVSVSDNPAGGGSGGSILLNVTTLNVSVGMVRSNGGAGGAAVIGDGAHGGGGGRIAILCRNHSFASSAWGSWLLSYAAYGGFAQSASVYIGAAGTVYFDCGGRASSLNVINKVVSPDAVQTFISVPDTPTWLYQLNILSGSSVMLQANGTTPQISISAIQGDSSGSSLLVYDAITVNLVPSIFSGGSACFMIGLEVYFGASALVVAPINLTLTNVSLLLAGQIDNFQNVAAASTDIRLAPTAHSGNDVAGYVFIPALTLGALAAIRVPPAGTLYVQQCLLQAGGNITLTAQSRLIATQLYLSSGSIIAVELNATILAVNATINAGSLITGRGAGYAGGLGPGSPLQAGYGGGYSGCGSQLVCDTKLVYGSIQVPVDAGSGGASGGGSTGGSGGAAVSITVSNTLLLSGTIDVSGNAGSRLGNSSSGSGAGSGGSIYISTALLHGSSNGSLIATGGAGASEASQARGGSGGRIAVHCNQNGYAVGAWALGMTAPGGKDASGNVAAPGTNYISCGVTTGTLFLNNGCTSSCGQLALISGVSAVARLLVYGGAGIKWPNTTFVNVTIGSFGGDGTGTVTVAKGNSVTLTSPTLTAAALVIDDGVTAQFGPTLVVTNGSLILLGRYTSNSNLELRTGGQLYLLHGESAAPNASVTLQSIVLKQRGSIVLDEGTSLSLSSLDTEAGGRIILEPSSILDVSGTLQLSRDVTVDVYGQATITAGNASLQPGSVISGASHGCERMDLTLELHSGNPPRRLRSITSSPRAAQYTDVGGVHAGCGSQNDCDYSILAFEYQDERIPYGSTMEPTACGASGSQGDMATGGRGGAAIRLHVRDTLLLAGSIDVTGEPGAEQPKPVLSASSGGAGGSIYITAGVLAAGSNGSLIASGGHGNINADNQDSRAGSGGRIALYCNTHGFPSDNLMSWAMAFIANGGEEINTNNSGAPGTVYIDCGTRNKTLIIAGLPSFPILPVTTAFDDFSSPGLSELLLLEAATAHFTTPASRSKSFVNVSYITGDLTGVVSLGPAVTFTLRYDVVWGALIVPAQSTLVVPATLTLPSGCLVSIEGVLHGAHDVSLVGGAVLDLLDGATTLTGGDVYIPAVTVSNGSSLFLQPNVKVHFGRLDVYDATVLLGDNCKLLVDTQLHLGADALVQVVSSVRIFASTVDFESTSQVYSVGLPGTGYGSISSCDGCGGTHAGCGSQLGCPMITGEDGAPYGSIYHPILQGMDGDAGSAGSAGASGSALQITVTNAAILAGLIDVSGSAGGNTGGGGSGGSLYITVGSLSNASTGTLKANGGPGYHGGSGGRMALYCASHDFQSDYDVDWKLKMDAVGGGSTSFPSRTGAAGTIFINCGTRSNALLVDNKNVSLEAAASVISEFQPMFTFSDLSILNGASLTWMNDSCVGSTVRMTTLHTDGGSVDFGRCVATFVQPTVSVTVSATNSPQPSHTVTTTGSRTPSPSAVVTATGVPPSATVSATGVPSGSVSATAGVASFVVSFTQTASRQPISSTSTMTPSMAVAPGQEHVSITYVRVLNSDLPAAVYSAVGLSESVNFISDSWPPAYASVGLAGITQSRDLSLAIHCNDSSIEWQAAPVPLSVGATAISVPLRIIIGGQPQDMVVHPVQCVASIIDGNMVTKTQLPFLLSKVPTAWGVFSDILLELSGNTLRGAWHPAVSGSDLQRLACCGSLEASQLTACMASCGIGNLTSDPAIIRTAAGLFQATRTTSSAPFSMVMTEGVAFTLVAANNSQFSTDTKVFIGEVECSHIWVDIDGKLLTVSSPSLASHLWWSE
jgi:hypothetical protein